MFQRIDWYPQNDTTSNRQPHNRVGWYMYSFFNSHPGWEITYCNPPHETWVSGEYAVYQAAVAGNYHPYFAIRSLYSWPLTSDKAEAYFIFGTTHPVGSQFGISFNDDWGMIAVGYSPNGSWNGSGWDSGSIALNVRPYSEEWGYRWPNGAWTGSNLIVNADAYTIAFCIVPDKINFSTYAGGLSSYITDGPVGGYLGKFNTPYGTNDTYPVVVLMSTFTTTCFSITKTNLRRTARDPYNAGYSLNYGLMPIYKNEENDWVYGWQRLIRLNFETDSDYDAGEDVDQKFHNKTQSGHFFEVPAQIWAGGQGVSTEAMSCNEYWGTLRFVKSVGRYPYNQTTTDPKFNGTDPMSDIQISSNTFNGYKRCYACGLSFYYGNDAR